MSQIIIKYTIWEIVKNSDNDYYYSFKYLDCNSEWELKENETVVAFTESNPKKVYFSI